MEENQLKPYRVECGECRYVLLRGEFPRAPRVGDNDRGRWRCPRCAKLQPVNVVEENPPGSWDSRRGVERKVTQHG